MTPDPLDIDLLGTDMPGIDVLAALVDLPIPSHHRAGTVLNLQRIAAAAAQVMRFELPPDVEPATIYANDRP